jgi:agmatine deiminase
MTWRMPSETEPQERIWMAFPPAYSTLGTNDADVHEARQAWADVAHAILDFEPVTMVVDPPDEAVARRYLSSEVEIRTAPLDDAWMRDIGPTFVLDEDDNLGAVDWVFNGWGQRDWATWEKDRLIGATVARWAGAELISSDLVNEGGGMHVDGLGTAIVTETVQLDPDRNPGLDKAAVEAELRRTIGADHVIWLPRGLDRDTGLFGTRGHVDLVACVPSAGARLVHVQRDVSHPDAAITQELIALFHDSVDVFGRPWQIVELPAPAVVRDEEGWVDLSYINHVVVNDAVIACSFDDANDDKAHAVLASAYPDREVVPVDASAIFARGGGLHCITQHQPRAASTGRA